MSRIFLFQANHQVEMKVLWVFALSLVALLANIELLPRVNAQVNYMSHVNYNVGKMNSLPPNAVAVPHNFPSNSLFNPQQQRPMSNGMIPSAPHLQNRAEIDATFRQNGQLYINGPGTTGQIGSPPTNLAGFNANFNPATGLLYRRECAESASGIVNGVPTINPSQCLQNQQNNNRGYAPINLLNTNLLQPLANTVASLVNPNLQNLPPQANLQMGLQRPLKNLNQPFSTQYMNANTNNNPAVDNINHQIQMARNQLFNQIQSQKNSLNNQMQNVNNQLLSGSNQVSQLIRNSQMAAHLQKLNQFNAMRGTQQMNLGNIHPLATILTNTTVGNTSDGLTNVGINITSTVTANNETSSKQGTNGTLGVEGFLGKVLNATALLTDNGKGLTDYLALVNSTVDTTSLLEKLLGTIEVNKSISYVEKREKPVCTNNSCKCCLNLEFGVIKNKVCLEVNITTDKGKDTPGKDDNSGAKETDENGSSQQEKTKSAAEKQRNGFCISGTLSVFGIKVEASLMGCFSVTDNAIKAILD